MKCEGEEGGEENKGGFIIWRRTVGGKNRGLEKVFIC